MNFEIITTTQRLDTICDHARTHSVVMLDTEFVRTRTLYPKLGLIQMFDGDNLVLIDPIEIEDLAAFSSDLNACYFGASNKYLTEYNKLKTNRSVESIMDL